MSVIEVLEKFDAKHSSVPGSDKSGWNRLINGALTKAANLFWTTSTVAPSLGPDIEEKVPAYSGIRSPSSEKYLSLSVDSTGDLYQSLDDTAGFTVTSPKVGRIMTPKFQSTPVKVDSIPEEGEAAFNNYNNPPTIPLDSSQNMAGFNSLSLADLCSEMERLSLKKIINEAEKTVADEIKEEFDNHRKALEDHDRRVNEQLTSEREKRGVEKELTEMNWFQRTRESQLKVEQSFNSKLDAILSSVQKKESKLQVPFSTPDRSEEKKTNSEQVAKKKALIESIVNMQKCYSSKYSDLLNLLNTSRVPLASEFHSDFDSLKKNNNSLFTDIISKSKSDNITDSDAEQCEKLLQTLCNVFSKIKQRNEEYENAMKQEEEATAKLNEALKKNQENSKMQTTVEEKESEEGEKGEKTVLVSSLQYTKRREERLKYYKYINGILKRAEDSLEPFLADDKYKDFRRNCQRAVNVPVNAIAPKSAYHLQDKLDKLTGLLNGKSVPVMDRKFNASSHPMGIKYCEVLLARKIVKAGEDVVSSHPETGHALASVVVSLIVRYPMLTVYLHAFFFRVCPYLVPLDLQSLKGESEELYNKRLGFNYDGGKREETDKFLKRMSGVAQLYGALLVANKRKGDSSVNRPLGVSELWLWITNFVSLEPLSDISATLLLDILEVTGHFMLTNYGYNFQKLLYLICTDYLGKIMKVTTKGRGGPVERLDTFLEDVIKVNRIQPPKGLLPSHFW